MLATYVLIIAASLRLLQYERKINGVNHMQSVVKQIPLGIKIGFSLFMLVLVPFYWYSYGPSNFLYFCDIALFLTLIGLWKENATLISAAAVGILLPQMLWVIDFVAMFFNIKIIGLTEYMFRDSISLFARGLSLFHGWLPFLLVYLVYKLGYCQKAFWSWTFMAWAAMLISFFFMPAPGDVLAHPNQPVNINYVYGFSETSKQNWLTDEAYLLVLMVLLPVIIYWPTAKLLNKFSPPK